MWSSMHQSNIDKNYNTLIPSAPHVLRLKSGSLNGYLHHGSWSRPCSSKICDWPLNLSQDHFGLHQEKNVRVIMELQVPKRPIFMPRSSIVMVQRVLLWERQKRFSCCKCQRTMAEKCHFNILFFFFLPQCFHSYKERREEEEKRSNMKKILQTTLFGHIWKK